MPSAERYAQYRADQTTIWVSKTAAAFLARERAAHGESTSVALDRLLRELRQLRRTGGTGGATRGAAAAGGARTRTAARTSRGSRAS
jgi:hypothetical protein